MSTVAERGGQPPAPAWAACLPQAEDAVAAWRELEAEWGPVEAAVDAMSGRSQGEQTEKAQREALLRVHQRLVDLGQERGTAYPRAFEAYMLHASGRCATGGGCGVGGFGCCLLLSAAPTRPHNSAWQRLARMPQSAAKPQPCLCRRSTATSGAPPLRRVTAPHCTPSSISARCSTTITHPL